MPLIGEKIQLKLFIKMQSGTKTQRTTQKTAKHTRIKNKPSAESPFNAQKLRRALSRCVRVRSENTRA